MARYVLASRRAGKFQESEKVAARAAAEAALEALAPVADVRGRGAQTGETARLVAVLDADPGDVARRRAAAGPDVIIEEEILHFHAAVAPQQFRTAAAAGKGNKERGGGSPFTLQVAGPGGPLPDAEVILYLRSRQGIGSLTAFTDGGGKVRFEFGKRWEPAAALVLPAGNHWSTVHMGPVDGQQLELPALPALSGGTAWWHDAHCLAGAPGAGAGIKVGVIDTGVGPHPHLDHVTNAGAFIDGSHDPTPVAGLDVDVHGTHVNGTVGARPTGSAPGPIGLAAGAELLSARVFPAGRGANQGDIANAIDHLSRERQADLVNMSLGAPQGSAIEQDAIIDALERGTLSICAAGNSDGPVEFPAGFPETVAVAALGLEGWAPAGTLAATRRPDEQDRFGTEGLFLANFSCFGDPIDVAAPGVGIVAPVPERFGLVAPLGALDGTSMASPAACATLAAALAGDATYGGLPRDATRAARARTVLAGLGRDIGLADVFQGDGLPCAGGG